MSFITNPVFYKMNSYQKKETLNQIAFRNLKFPGIQNGIYQKNNVKYYYPHILPEGNESKSYYGDYENIRKYFTDNDIAFSSESLNLKSSQVCCINLLFPFKLDLAKATVIFKCFYPNLHSVSRIEFEYTGDHNEYKELGEPNYGRRGYKRTSIDVAVFWRDKTNREQITFIEWKYTEADFGGCSTFGKTCVLKSPEKHCPLTLGYNPRTYWDLLEKAGINIYVIKNIKGCLFRGPFYQLMRQYLLAYLVSKNQPGVIVDLLSISFKDNKSILEIPIELKNFAFIKNAKDIIDIWNAILKPPALPLKHITIEEFIKAVDSCGVSDISWRTYIKERYGL